MNTAVNCWDAGNVRILELNRPERRNAINREMVSSLRAALSAAEADEGVRAIILRGKGKAFCVGDDLDEQVQVIGAGPIAVSAQLEALQDVTRGLMFGAKPVVGAIQGWAVGAGFSWALNCDVTIWAEGSGAFSPEIEFGMFFTGALTWALPALGGEMFAHDVMVLGRRVSAEELRSAGVTNHIVPPSELNDQTLAIAQKIAALPISSLRAARTISINAKRSQIERALQAETHACLAALSSAEVTDGHLQQVFAMRRK